MVKKVKIGIIELYGHHVFVHTLASLGLKVIWMYHSLFQKEFIMI